MADEARRARIVGTALRALDEQPYEHVQMRDVAAATGIALGTLYRHFSSKEHLYATVLLEWAAAGRSEAARRAGHAPRRPAAKVRARIHGVIAAYCEQPQFYRVQVLLHSSADPNARAVMTEFDAIARAVLAEDLSTLVPAAGAADAATMLWSLVTSRLTGVVYGDGDPAEVHRLADRFVDLLERRRP
jgi:AcrR family transcriptional regulator